MENPLQSYYRTKELYVRLPTQGKWMKNPPILSEDGEIGVRAMSMKDELLLTIPDALYNGQAIFELIQSVCPDITDPTEVSLPDVDVILLASRASSYDKIFPVETTCPYCKKQAMHEIDLQIVLGKVTHIYEKTEVEIDELIIEMRPNTLSAVNANNIKTTETARMLLELRNQKDNINASLQEKYSDNMQQIAAANFVLIADAIVKVTMPDGVEVTDMQNIIDWLSNTNRKTIDVLNRHQAKMNINGIPREFDFTCASEECGKSFKSGVDFNPSFFFTNKSLEQEPLKT
tara:strand:- start:338 stop:1204 length:867 start_codon:yes stop_codon:yes gene_type:complete